MRVIGGRYSRGFEEGVVLCRRSYLGTAFSDHEDFKSKRRRTGVSCV